MTDDADRLAVAIFEGWDAEVDGQLIAMKLVRADGREHNYSPHALARDAALSVGIEFVLDYWKVVAALCRAFDGDSDAPGFAEVVVELSKDYPEYAWANALTERGRSVDD